MSQHKANAAEIIDSGDGGKHRLIVVFVAAILTAGIPQALYTMVRWSPESKTELPVERFRDALKPLDLARSPANSPRFEIFARKSAEELYTQGLIAYAAKRFEKSARLFEETLRSDPNHQRARNALLRVRADIKP